MIAYIYYFYFKAVKAPRPTSPVSTVSSNVSAATLLNASQSQSQLSQITPVGSNLQPIDISNMKSIVELTENQKKLLGMTSADDPSASLEQQVEMTLKGKEQRLLLMQKLMLRRTETNILILRNMVGPEDVDDELELEITGNFGLFFAAY